MTRLGVTREQYCAALDCRELASRIVDHPRFGARAVCETHANDYNTVEVLGRVQ